MGAYGSAACGTMFTFLMTTLGAALVFALRSSVGERENRLCLGFAGGVMSAASVFSLLVPAMGQAHWLTITLGFLAGAGALVLLDGALSALQIGETDAARRRMLMIGAVTLHNIPEGMAVGVAFALAAGGEGFAAACALALGVGVQNFPEGAAISLPLRQGGMSRRRSFALGALSGAVEPVFGVLAAGLAVSSAAALPLMMALSAGAMMWAVFSQMLPEAAQGRCGVIAALLGFALMMAMDVALG